MFKEILRLVSNILLGNERTHNMLEAMAIRMAGLEALAAEQAALAVDERQKAELERLAAAAEREAAATARAEADARLRRIELRAQAAGPMTSPTQTPTVRTQRHPDSPD